MPAERERAEAPIAPPMAAVVNPRHRSARRSTITAGDAAVRAYHYAALRGAAALCVSGDAHTETEIPFSLEIPDGGWRK
jgi:hypothetical protein